jgi:hypothetical protein
MRMYIFIKFTNKTKNLLSKFNANLTRRTRSSHSQARTESHITFKDIAFNQFYSGTTTTRNTRMKTILHVPQSI